MTGLFDSKFTEEQVATAQYLILVLGVEPSVTLDADGALEMAWVSGDVNCVLDIAPTGQVEGTVLLGKRVFDIYEVDL